MGRKLCQIDYITMITLKFLNGNELIGYYHRNHESGVTKGILQEFNNFEEENKDGKFDNVVISAPSTTSIYPSSLYINIYK